MIPTDNEKRRAALVKARQERAAEYQKNNAAKQGVVNPLYGTDPFEPSAYLPTVPSDPALSEPLPSGRFIDPRFPSGAAAARAAEINEFLKQPDRYVNENIGELNNEQSLIDKGKSMLARIFDYNDEADTQFFGVNLSAVESTWDGFLRYFTGAYDLLSIGFGGLLSAAPGGLQTLSYDELSGGLSVGEVLSGEMKPGMAPSPGQIAITSIALEAKRIREGNARLSDVLLLNPATAPFILAALAADTSPLQKNGFNIMDVEQREAAFASGWEQWMSGITDAGLMFADPLIGVGVAGKVMRAGLLGKPGSLKAAQNMRGALDDAVEEVAPGSNQRLEEVLNIGVSRQRAAETPEGIVRRIAEDPEYTPTQYVEPVTFNKADPMPKYNNPLSAFLHRLHTVDDQGKRTMTPDEISRDPSFDQVTDKATIADLLYKSNSPAESSLILQAFVGTPGAKERLAVLNAGMADVVFRFRREAYAAQAIFTEPQKVKEVGDSLLKQIDNTRQSIDNLDEQLRGVSGIADEAEAFTQNQNLLNRRNTLQQNLEELTELYKVAVDGKEIDLLDPTNPFYRADVADEIVTSLFSANDAHTRMMKAQLFDAGMTSKTFLPSTNNAYSHMVMNSRGRRQKARYQYAAEGTSIFPRKVVTKAEDGKVTQSSDGWFSASQFEGTNRFQRNIRIWRWLGAETPSGYLGLKGAASVGSEREFTAALDTDLYRGAGVEVTRDAIDPKTGQVILEKVTGTNGKESLRVKKETVTIGGIEARQNYYREFYEALNNPDMDAAQVLENIERKVMNDYAAAYGLDKDKLEGLLNVANKKRAQNLSLVREKGYFVDPDDKSIQIVPYLDSQLANGTYMQNFQSLEKILKRQIAKDGGENLRQKLTVPFELAGSAYNLFNDFWRPLTLMRFSYTQRNIFEGTLRAMAYSASLSPLLWPVKGTAFGVRNAVVKRAIERRTKLAAKKIESSEYGQYLREHNDAIIEEYYWKSAIRNVDADDAEPMVTVFQPDRSAIKMTEREYAEGLEAVMQRTTAAKEALKDNADKFTESIKGTAFGKWREQNIKDLETKLAEHQASLENIMETARDLADDGFSGVLDETVLRNLAEITAAKSKLQIDLDALMYDPAKATALYRTQAGRQKRIGSGRSLGPGGTYYDDAWTGPYEQINRDLMSADTTITQTLSLQADTWSSLFYKSVVRPNSAVDFTEGTINEWAAGMVDAIEEASSSWVVRSLVKNNWDEAAVLREMTSTDDGTRFLTRIMSLMGEGNLKDVADTIPDAYFGKEGATGPVPVTERTKLKPFAETERTAAGARQTTVTDLDQARVYINEVANQVKGQMQNRQEFMALLERRVFDKTRGEAVEATKIDVDAVKTAIDLIPAEQRQMLGYIQGANIVRYGSDSVLNVWAKLTSKVFRALGTIPEDAITRGGFYNMEYKAARNSLIEAYLVNSGQEAVLRRKRARGKSNAEQGGTISHDEFTIPASELSRIQYQAHRQALKNTREWMYTIERRTKLGKYGEWIFPFISATQNSTTVAGKLLYKEPWLAPLIADLWRMPNRLGIEDEEGNILIPMPFDWVRKTLQDNPNIPIIGGVIGPDDNLRIPKDGINVFMPETGFGIAPRPTPWVQVAASELMKANAFPVETPAILRNSLGTEAGDEFYQTFKDYIFGEDQGASAEFLSLDKITPAYIQKVFQSKNELSSQWGYQHTLQYHTQMMRYRAGERDTMPTEDEINKRTTNAFWFGVLGNLGVPTPLTPYPIITRPMVDSPVSVLQDVYQRLQEADPLTANMNMDRMFGDWALEAANTKVSQNVGGANPTPATVSDISTLTPLIRSIAPDLGPNDLGVLGILINNRRAPSAYEQSAYQWQKSETIPGTNRQWREVQSAEQAVAERQRLTGWTVYRQAIDQLDAQLQSAGLSSYEVKAAAPFKAAKERVVENMLSNPDYAGWIVDFQDRGGSKTLSAVRVLEAGVQDDTFRNLLVTEGKERLLGIMDEYVQARRLLLRVLEQSGHSIEHDSNIMWKIGWDAMRTKWRNEDERWAEIDSLYLSGDSNPQSPGNIYLLEMANQGVMQ